MSKEVSRFIIVKGVMKHNPNHPDFKVTSSFQDKNTLGLAHKEQQSLPTKNFFRLFFCCTHKSEIEAPSKMAPH